MELSVQGSSLDAVTGTWGLSMRARLSAWMACLVTKWRALDRDGPHDPIILPWLGVQGICFSMIGASRIRLCGKGRRSRSGPAKPQTDDTKPIID